LSEDPDTRKARMAETVRQIVTRRERAPRSPRLERALKRLIWRYTFEQDTREPSAPEPAEGEVPETALGTGAHGA
jgi:hypothetical protein